MEWIKKLRWKAARTDREAVEKEEEEDDGLETPEEYKSRWVSVRVIYFTMFLMSLGFSVVLTGVWPYLDKLDPKAGKEFMGYVVAANPFGQIVFSVLVGYWSNKIGSVRKPLLTTIVIFILANMVYTALETFESHKKYWMVCSRFFVGASSANTAVTRSYLSAATRIKERTAAVAMVSLAQVLGFVFGPIIQAWMTPLGDEGYQIVGDLRLNMYTATGWLNVILGMLNFVLLLPFFFTEHKIAAKEIMKYRGIESEKEACKAIKPDRLPCWTLIITFFVLGFNFVLVETLATPLTMDQFAWNKSQSIYNMGIIMTAGAIVACITFYFTAILAKMFEERKLLLYGGFFITTLASVFLMPWGPDPPQLALPENMTLQDLRDLANSPNYAGFTLKEIVTNMTKPGEEVLGCPVDQEWCFDTKAVTIVQLCIAYTCASIGYPLGVTLIQTLLSKLLGPRPQGVWMGLMTSSGCVSRMLGPLFVGYVYTRLGTIWTFSSTIGLMVVAMIWIRLVSYRLVPMELNKDKMGTEMIDIKITKPDENGISEHSKLFDNGNAKSEFTENGNLKTNL